MSSKQISNPSGAFGYTDLQTQLWSLQAPFKASAAISAKRVVALGTDGQVITATTNTVSSTNIGISGAAIASGYVGNVILFGIAEDVPAAGAVAAGDLLRASGTTAGYVSATATPTIGQVVGVAINASSSNTVDVWVLPAKTLS